MIRPLEVLGGAFLAAFVLAILTPAIREFALATYSNVQGQFILLDFILIGFVPFLWFMFVLAVGLFFILSVRTTGGDSDF